MTRLSYEARENLSFFIAIAVMVLGLALLIGGGVVGLANRLEFPIALSRVEQLRTDAADVDAAQAEDVIGQVVETNRRIAAKHACNRTWYCDWLETDKWNSVALISVPKKVGQ